MTTSGYNGERNLHRLAIEFNRELETTKKFSNDLIRSAGLNNIEAWVYQRTPITESLKQLALQLDQNISFNNLGNEAFRIVTQNFSSEIINQFSNTQVGTADYVAISDAMYTISFLLGYSVVMTYSKFESIRKNYPVLSR